MNEEEIKDKKDYFLGCVEDSVSDFCYYDRKNCDEISVEDVEILLDEGHVTIKEITDRIAKVLKKNFDIKEQ
jgi:hypothetical protein